MFEERFIEEIELDFYSSMVGLTQEELNTSKSSPLYVLARANASVISRLESDINFSLRKNNILMASGDDLDEAAEGLATRTPATTATGSVIIEPVSAFLNLPARTILTELDTGLQFYTEEAESLVEFVSTTVRVQATTAGSEYNLPAGTRLYCEQFPFLVVNVGSVRLQTGEIVGGLAGGRGAEPDFSFRDRLLTNMLLTRLPASTAVIRNMLQQEENVTRSFVKTRVGGIVEVWVNTLFLFSEDERRSLQERIQAVVPAGIIVVVSEFKIKTFDISLKVLPFNSSANNLTFLNNQISSVYQRLVNSLDLGEGLTKNTLLEAVKPFVQRVTLLSPTEDQVPALDEALVLSSTNVSYPSI